MHRLRVLLLLFCTGLSGLRVPLLHTAQTDVVYSQSSSALYGLDLSEPTSTQTGQGDTPDATQTNNVKVNSDTIVHSAGSPSLAASTSPRSQKDVGSSGLAIILPTAGITIAIALLWLVRSSIAPYVPTSICDRWEKLRQHGGEFWQRMGRKWTSFQDSVGKNYMERLPSPVMLSLVGNLKDRAQFHVLDYVVYHLFLVMSIAMVILPPLAIVLDHSSQTIMTAVGATSLQLAYLDQRSRILVVNLTNIKYVSTSKKNNLKDLSKRCYIRRLLEVRFIEPCLPCIEEWALIENDSTVGSQPGLATPPVVGDTWKSRRKVSVCR